MLYHYTDRISGAEIRKSGVIRAAPARLYLDVVPDEARSLVTPPIVWMTINPIVEMTVLLKLQAAGWPGDPCGDLWRFAFPDGYAGDLGLGEYTELAQIDHDWWTRVVQTGALAGSHYTTWRIVPRDVPLTDCVGVEVLAAIGPSGRTVWKPV